MTSGSSFFEPFLESVRVDCFASWPKRLADLSYETGAALGILSSLHLLIYTFPDPVGQAKAVSAFADSGALRNGESPVTYSLFSVLTFPVLGLIVRALIISYAT